MLRMNVMRKNVYSFVADNGDNVHIDVDELKEWIKGNPREIHSIYVNREHAEKIYSEGAVDLAHVQELLFRGNPFVEPVIIAKDGGGTEDAPDVMLVDGHHRYYLAAMANVKSIPAWVLEVDEWKMFELRGLPSLTKEQLISIPVKKGKWS